MRKVNGPFIVAAAALSAGCQSFQHARDIEQIALVEMDAARQQWHKHSAPRRAAQSNIYAENRRRCATSSSWGKAEQPRCYADSGSGESVRLAGCRQGRA